MEISQKEIQALEKEVSPLITEAGSYKIDSVEAVDNASLFLRKLKDAENNLEAKRVTFTAPLNQSLKAINDTFRQLRTPIEQARMVLTNAILAWKRAENERLAKEEARRRAIQESHAEKGHEVSAPVVLERPEAKIGNTQTVKVWTFGIVDIAQIPDAYKLVNETAVRQAIREGVREIPGVRIFQEERLSIVNR